MNSGRFDTLELLARIPARPKKSTPLLFIHGAYTGAWCWADTFLPYFEAAGYASYALSLSGHGKSLGREHLNTLSIADYVADTASVIAQLPTPPVLIGHSMGGFVVQRYLEQHKLPAAALLCSVPPQGLLTTAIGVLLHQPNLMRDLNKLMSGGTAGINTLKEALFAQPITQERLEQFLSMSQPESLRALWDMTLFNLPHTDQITRTPLLIIGAQEDRLIPPALVEATARTFQSPCDIFAGMGHGLMLEQGWQAPADRLLQWLKELAL